MASSLQNEKPNRLPQYLVVLSASLCFFTRGLHQAWPSPSLPILLNKTTNFTDILGNEVQPHHFSISTEEASWVVVIYSTSISIGGPLAAFLIHHIGRKNTILFTAIPHLAAFIIIALAPSVEYLLAARLLAGLSEGISNLALPIYVGEVADSRVRGRLGCMASAIIIMGLLTVNIVGSLMTIPYTAVICCTFPILLLASSAWLPESPYHLLMHQKRDKAERSLTCLRGSKHAAKELTAITAAVEKQLINKSTFKDLFMIRSNRRALIITLVMEAIQQASGIFAIQAYTQIIFIESKQKISHQMSAILLMLVQLIFSIIASSFVDRWGRKPLLIVSCIGCALALMFESIYFYLQMIGSPYLVYITWLPLVGLFLFIALYSVGLAIVLNLLVGELFSLRFKGKALGLNVIWYGILVFIISRSFQVLIDLVGLYSPFALYALNCVFGIFYITYFVPETKGKTLDEIQDWFKEK